MKEHHAERSCAELIIRWVARATSIVSIGVTLLFVIGEGPNPSHLDLQQWALFAFFPFGVCVGMVVAWWNERLGGLITIICCGLFYLLHLAVSGRFPRGPFFLLFSLPGFLFIISWAFSRRQKRKVSTEPIDAGDE